MLNEAEPALPSKQAVLRAAEHRNSTDSSNSLPTPSPERTLATLHESPNTRTPISSWKTIKDDIPLHIDTTKIPVGSVPTPRSPESGLDSSLPSSVRYHSRNSSVDSIARRGNTIPFARPSVETPQEEASNGSLDAPAKVDTDGATSKEPEAYCMFVKNCDTGSQLRKAISHLFGRNKACTLRIPKHVWVYYCRKHYQRVRYRNAKTYPLNQMELVKLQIQRLQSWSEENKVAGNGPFIRLWTLSLRKREQNRIERKDRPAGSRSEVVGVPKWLLERVGTGYTTVDMLEVADKLYAEIQSGHLSQIPEVEFLPDIVESSSEANKVARRRKSSSNVRTPKRKTSEESDAMHRHSEELAFRDFYRRPSSYDGYEDLASPLGKRLRVAHSERSLPSLADAISYDANHRPVGHARAQSISARVPHVGYTPDRSLSHPGHHRHSVSMSSEYSIHSQGAQAMGHPPTPVLREYRDSPLPSIRGSFEAAERGRQPSIFARPHGMSAEYHDAYDRPHHVRSSSAYTLAGIPAGEVSRLPNSNSEPRSQFLPRNFSDERLAYDRRAEEERARMWHNRETLAYRAPVSSPEQPRARHGW